mmetsp:Transcript_2270/g.3904  ORF Transcript_2270/g.3904 Transcript_2270/m.3904 type:complete len:117 (-) Transcript_2270:2116-2466(-)
MLLLLRISFPQGSLWAPVMISRTRIRPVLNEGTSAQKTTRSQLHLDKIVFLGHFLAESALAIAESNIPTGANIGGFDQQGVILCSLALFLLRTMEVSHTPSPRSWFHQPYLARPGR